jgi:hypothetical protein
MSALRPKADIRDLGKYSVLCCTWVQLQKISERSLSLSNGHVFDTVLLKLLGGLLLLFDLINNCTRLAMIFAFSLF